VKVGLFLSFLSFCRKVLVIGYSKSCLFVGKTFGKGGGGGEFENLCRGPAPHPWWAGFLSCSIGGTMEGPADFITLCKDHGRFTGLGVPPGSLYNYHKRDVVLYIQDLIFPK